MMFVYICIICYQLIGTYIRGAQQLRRRVAASPAYCLPLGQIVPTGVRTHSWLSVWFVGIVFFMSSSRRGLLLILILILKLVIDRV